MFKKHLVSVIVPTYNEEKDIAKTLFYLSRLSYKYKEIIIVDSGSKDRTKEIILNYSKKYPFIRGIFEKERNGVSSARNLGIKNSRGEIIIILNADVLLPSNFIKKILPHYERGADFVLVNARAKKQKKQITARWVNAIQDCYYSDINKINWTEGFSMRKSLFLKSREFPNVGKSCGGEDHLFTKDLIINGAKKVLDKKIKVYHFVEPKIISLLKERGANRGRSGVFMRFYALNYSKYKIFTYTLFASAYYLFNLIIPLLPFIRAFKITKYSHEGHKDFFPFLILNWLEFGFKLIWSWKALFHILINE
jgi:glycosyltransferase involved in cell wall biosynthesis